MNYVTRSVSLSKTHNVGVPIVYFRPNEVGNHLYFQIWTSEAENTQQTMTLSGCIVHFLDMIYYKTYVVAVVK